MRHVGDPEPGPRYEKGVRFYEGEPDAPDGQWVRVMQFENGESRQAFYNQVAAKVGEWNRDKPGHRMPEMVSRTITPWSDRLDDSREREKRIEHAAQVMSENADRGVASMPWESMPDSIREQWRQNARALDAAGLLRGGGRGE